MAKPRFTRSTRIEDFAHGGEFVTVLHKNGIFTVGGFLSTPFTCFIERKDLFAHWDDYTETVLHLYRLVAFNNFTL